MSVLSGFIKWYHLLFICDHVIHDLLSGQEAADGHLTNTNKVVGIFRSINRVKNTMSNSLSSCLLILCCTLLVESNKLGV